VRSMMPYRCCSVPIPLPCSRSIPSAALSEMETCPRDIALHLARHRVKASAAHTVAKEIPAGDALLNYASDNGADLIVAGGYGHSRTRELVFGGVTRTLLTAMTVPVFLSH
jgi:nucleotide-binding universal stress UspA family protein